MARDVLNYATGREAIRKNEKGQITPRVAFCVLTAPVLRAATVPETASLHADRRISDRLSTTAPASRYDLHKPFRAKPSPRPSPPVQHRSWRHRRARHTYVWRSANLLSAFVLVRADPTKRMCVPARPKLVGCHLPGPPDSIRPEHQQTCPRRSSTNHGVDALDCIPGRVGWRA